MTSRVLTSRSAGGIGILESEPWFAPELQRQFAGDEIAVQSFRRTGDLTGLAQPRVCILSLNSDRNAVVDFLLNVRNEPNTACVVISSAGTATDWEWSLREIGAVTVIDPFVPGTELAAICRRLLTYRNSLARAHTGVSCL